MFNSYRLCPWAVVARALVRFMIIGAQEERRCTRRAAMHEKGFDALGASACTWWSSVQLEKLDALGKLRCTWRPLSAEKTVARCIEA